MKTNAISSKLKKGKKWKNDQWSLNSYIYIYIVFKWIIYFKKKKFWVLQTKKRSRSSTTTPPHQNQNCTVRYQDLIQGLTVKEQATVALSYIHSWCRIQDEIRARRQCMVKETRIRQKKLENQLKLDVKLHELEVLINLLHWFYFLIFFQQHLKIK